MSRVITGRGLKFNVMPGVTRLVVRDVPVGVRMANPFFMRRQGEKKVMPKDLRRNLYALSMIKSMCGTDKAKEVRRVLAMWCAGEEFVCGEGVLKPLFKSINMKVDFNTREISRRGHRMVDDYYFTFLRGELKKICKIDLGGMFVPTRSFASVKKLSATVSDKDAADWLVGQYESGEYFKDPRFRFYGGKYDARVFEGIREDVVRVGSVTSVVRSVLVTELRTSLDNNLKKELVGVLEGTNGWLSRKLERMKNCKLTGLRKKNFDKLFQDRRYFNAAQLVDTFSIWFDEAGYNIFERMVEFARRRPAFKIVKLGDPG